MLAPWTALLRSMAMAATVISGSALKSAATFVVEQPFDVIMTGGASMSAAPLNSLRSGNPKMRAAAAIRAVLNPGATIERVACAYRYDTGFGPTGEGANFTLRVAGRPVYASPHFTDYSYGHNRSNYSKPVPIDVAALGIVVPPAPAASRIQFDFDNHDLNVQLLLPLEVHIECSGDVPCTPPPPPPPSRTLHFGAPSYVSGPKSPTGGGPFWTNIHSLSETHALGWADTTLIGTTDGGRTWITVDFNDSATCPECDASTADVVYEQLYTGGFKTLGRLQRTEGSATNITAWGANASTRYSVRADGRFARSLAGGVSIVGLPSLRMFGLSGGYTTLSDGSMVGIAKSELATGVAKLSAVAYRSTDGGFRWGSHAQARTPDWRRLHASFPALTSPAFEPLRGQRTPRRSRVPRRCRTRMRGRARARWPYCATAR